MAENLFGMFIHWGLYAKTGLQEQAIVRYSYDKKEYEDLAKTFNPTKYNPDKWVKNAKKAGVEYICFTTKHHDGFCMWDTQFTDYKITNTPYGKDILKELADACNKYGVKLSLYYSNPDWNYKNGYNPHASHQWYAVNKDKPDLDAYINYIKNQVTELLSNYGKIYSFFWDIPPRFEDKTINELVRKLQPGIFINDRGWDAGDFSTPEREYQSSDGKRFTRMTEACNSVGEQSWGYREREDFYSMRYLLSAVDKMMAMGASYLLNVGPDEKGVIKKKYFKRFNKVGKWFKKHKQALKADEDAFNYEIMCNDYIATKDDEFTYLHFYNGLISDSVAIKNYPSMPKSVTLLNNGKNLEYCVELLPEFCEYEEGKALEYLHFRGIPVDKFSSEPIIVKIKW